MADILHDQRIADQDLRAHQQTFAGFGKLVFFSILHVLLVLSCLALAFLGHVPIVAVILGVGGTVALLAAFAIMG